MVAGTDLRLGGALESTGFSGHCVSAYAFTIIKSTVAYRVAVFFRAAPLAAPAVVRSTEGVESTDEKKPLATAIPVETLPNIPPTRVFGKAEIACVSGLCLCCFRRQQLQCITAYWSLQEKLANVLKDKPLHPPQESVRPAVQSVFV